MFSPTCGYLQPNSMVAAYARAARDLGVTVAPDSAVTALGIRGGAVRSVSTTDGEFATEMIIVAAGPWSAALAKLAGLELPVVPVLHEYFVTEPRPGWHSGLPCLRIPEIQVYARAEGERILCGGFETQGTSLDPRGVSVGSPLGAAPNWDVLGGFADGLDQFVPDPSPYVRSLSPDRYLPRTWSWEDAERQARHVYETYYPMPEAPAVP